MQCYLWHGLNSLIGLNMSLTLVECCQDRRTVQYTWINQHVMLCLFEASGLNSLIGLNISLTLVECCQERRTVQYTWINQHEMVKECMKNNKKIHQAGKN
jgi:hypothetical protein